MIAESGPELREPTPSVRLELMLRMGIAVGLIGAFVASACGGSSSEEASTDPVRQRTCTDVQNELFALRACSSDAECGTEVQGSSCGCTRNLVVRRDADLARIKALLEETIGGKACFGGATTCDCPAADGFACRQGLCTWNYLSR